MRDAPVEKTRALLGVRATLKAVSAKSLPRGPRSRRAGRCFGLVLAAACSLPARAFAQQADEPLALAERAYSNLDYDAAVRNAEAALQRGGNDRRHLAQIYRLIGLSRAASGSAEAARDAFVRYLALEPESRLDRGLSPTMRAPFMEARGYWGEHTEHTDVTPRRVRDGMALEVAVADPAGMIRTVVLRARLGSSGAFVETRRPASARVVLDLPAGAPAARVEYSLRADDDRGNHVIERGSDDSPEVFLAPQVASVGGPAGPSTSGGSSPWPAIGGVGIGIGVLLLATGGIAVGVREGAAAQWNDDMRCLNPAMPGNTREQNCGSQLSTINNMDVLAGVGFVAGGLFVLGGVVIIAAAPRGGARAEQPPRPAFLGCGPGPGALGVGCALRF
jgi:hypothetical protein